MDAITEQPRPSTDYHGSTNADPILLSTVDNLNHESKRILPLSQIESNKNKCNSFSWLMRCLYCCFASDTSELTLRHGISRYEEEFLLTVQDYVDELTNNQFLISVLETICTSYPDYFFTYLPTGSLREGFGKLIPSSSILATDHDVMLVPDAASIGEAGVTYHNATPVFSAIEAPDERLAGYLWLKLEDKYLTQWETLCLRRHVGEEGCSILSASKWRETLRKTLADSMALHEVTHEQYEEKIDNVKVKIEINGPALTVDVSATTVEGNCTGEESRKYFYADFTLGLHCVMWPKKAKGFFTSEFRANWPPKEAVDTIAKLGCHVVPKSSTHKLVKLSLEQAECTTFGQSPGLEWRYSFSQPEIILSKYIPPPAKTAYLAFKALVKKHFNRDKKKIKTEGKICSFALKCILYRIVERKEKEFWKTDNDEIVEQVFREMLDELNNNLDEGHCSNYWIPQINLFDEMTPKNLLDRREFMKKVLSQPENFVVDEWLEYTRFVRKNCCYCFPTIEIAGNCSCPNQLGCFSSFSPPKIKLSDPNGTCCSSNLYKSDPLSMPVY